MRAEVTLGAAVRENLLSLKKTSEMANTASSRISSGLKVRSASDNAVAYFQAKSLSDRAGDFIEVKDKIEQGISSLGAAMNGAGGIESLVQQLKGIVLSAAGKSGSELAVLAEQFDELRSQITNIATDTIYQGVSLTSSTSAMTVALSPAGAASVDVAGKDLRISNQVTTEDIRSFWMDDNNGDSNYTLASRDFSSALSATSDETITGTTVGGGGWLSLKAARTLDGGSAVVYQGTSVNDVNLKLLGPDGVAVCADISVSTTSDSGSNFDVTTLSDGRIAVAVGGIASGLVDVSLYNTDGSLSTSFSVSGMTVDLTVPQVSINARAGGGFVVATSGPTNVEYAVYDSTPSAVVATTQISQSAGPNIGVSSAGLTGGGAVAVWKDTSLTPNGAVARLVDSSGALSGAEFQVDTGAGGNSAGLPVVTGLADGGFVTAWRQGTDILAKIYNANGSVRTAEYAVVTNAGVQEEVKLDALPSGGFAISWADNVTDGSGNGTFAATYNASGTVVTAATRLNQTTANNQSQPVVAKHALSDLSAATDTSAGTVKVREALNYRNFASAANRNAALADIDDAIATIRAASGHFITNMALLNVRLEFTKNYSETLSAGAGKLTLADLNEEGANALALQTRSQLGIQALTFSGQSEQSILKLFA